MKKNNWIKIVILSVMAIFSVCFVAILGISAFDNGSDDERAKVDTDANISTIVAGTSWAASTQTMLAMPPTSTREPLATPTISSSATVTYTMTFASTFTSIPTNTIVVLATQPQATQASGGACSCSGDLYNCSSFSSYSGAKSCFDHCISLGVGDIHRLDHDNDGKPCESLR